MTTTQPHNRARIINDIYHAGCGNSLDILRADFGGVWPPHGLTITTTPAHDITIERYARLFSDETAHVSNQERALCIHMNLLNDVTALFNRASTARADTISHENIHILQKVMIRNGLGNVFGQFARVGIKNMRKKNLSEGSHYASSEDELQVRIHLLVSRYYRDHGKIPMNQHELLSLMHHEGVNLDKDTVAELYKSEQGLRAVGIFFKDPKSRPFLKSEPVQNINTAIHAIDDQHKVNFCRVALPALYGSLLEIYGDREGSRRMGYKHNISLTDMFLHQAATIQYRIDNKLTPDTTRIKTVMDAMPDDQKDDLSGILRRGSFTHPLSGRTRLIGTESAQMIAPLLAPQYITA